MLERNAYLSYKQSTQQLIQWLVRVSNAIIKARVGKSDLSVNTTGQIKPRELVILARLVARHTKKIPDVVLSLLKHVIDARTAFNKSFEARSALSSDSRVKLGNQTHAHFIGLLQDTFIALRGEEYFANAFSSLDLAIGLSNDEVDKTVEEPSQIISTKQARKRTKSGAGRKPRTRSSTLPSPDQQLDSMFEDNIPLEAFRFVHEDAERRTDYFMAIFSFFHEWVNLRKQMQLNWSRVAFGKDNAAVIGGTSNHALSIIRRAADTIAQDFPGEDGFDNMLFTLDYIFKISHGAGSSRSSPVIMTGQNIPFLDAKEALSMHTFYDLVDFISDYQQNRNGKPTKDMAKKLQLDLWNPHADLTAMSDSSRLLWRRKYTINHLYELVNAWRSAPAAASPIGDRQNSDRTVPVNLFGDHRGLFGLAPFAEVIAEFAMQKPNQAFRSKITPALVFQLQMMVDSFTACRGWIEDPFKGHLFHDASIHGNSQPYESLRDVETFLRGFPQDDVCFISTIQDLYLRLEGENEAAGKLVYPEALISLLRKLQWDVIRDLGVSHLASGENGTPSRFTRTTRNGLWEYSPYLAGMALAKCLEVIFEVSMKVFDIMPEPLQIAHIYHKLIQTKTLKDVISMHTNMQNLFRVYFFGGSLVPANSFETTYIERVAARSMHPSTRNLLKNLEAYDTSLESNRLFRLKSQWALFRDVDYNQENISDEDISMYSHWGGLVIARCSVNGRVPTSRPVLRDRCKLFGVKQELVVEVAKHHRAIADACTSTKLKAFMGAGDLGSTANSTTRGPVGFASLSRDNHIGHACCGDNADLLYLSKAEYNQDIWGRFPYSGVNYFFFATKLLDLSTAFKEEIESNHKPFWQKVLMGKNLGVRDLKDAFTRMILATDDKKCLNLIAKVFQTQAQHFEVFLYWRRLQMMPDTKEGTLNYEAV
ncbi:hypothetical protein KVT40_004360 [Elsinoe batatas]|uniref:DUF6604 domain-containing protein n=1 Tax=Elsinoe batatas TaxID=2601811 RepID=A0A8K0PHF6_9PEZI|nr:hypothetical protein KVT40_004360 [Elsinoe batatas]